jgi:tetratricopeptide (TPR) repeat protein
LRCSAFQSTTAIPKCVRCSYIIAQYHHSKGMRVFCVVWGGVVGLAVFAPAARAGSVKETARAEWEQASVEYTLGHFETAARAYEEAYRLVPDPALLFDLGQARRRAGAAEAALTAYQSFLRLSRADAPDRDIAEKRIQELEASLAAKASAPTHAPVNLELPASEGLTSAALLSPPPIDGARRPKPWWLWSAAGAVVVAAGIAILVVLAKPQQDVIPGKDGTVTIR